MSDQQTKTTAVLLAEKVGKQVHRLQEIAVAAHPPTAIADATTGLSALVLASFLPKSTTPEQCAAKQRALVNEISLLCQAHVADILKESRSCDPTSN
ncbi:MAG: hypothetical protein AAFP15_15780 [Bacteroidota bacterium]